MGEFNVYTHFDRIKGSMRDPRKCTGKQMHSFVASFHCVRARNMRLSAQIYNFVDRHLLNIFHENAHFQCGKFLYF